MEFSILTYDEIGSTNDAIKEAISQGHPEGLVICAKKQTIGRGRQGRAWTSPEGGLYMSMLLRPSMEGVETLTLIAGLAVQRALRTWVKDALVKWPNDIVVFDEAKADQAPANGNSDVAAFPYSKVCGVLAEAREGAICLGIGINVLRPQEGFEVSMASPAYVEDFAASKPSIDEVRDRVLDEFKAIYNTWKASGFAAFVDEYNASNALASHHVVAQDIDGNVRASGVASSVDSNGNMVIESSDGSQIRVRSGEVHLTH